MLSRGCRGGFGGVVDVGGSFSGGWWEVRDGVSCG